MWMRTIGDRGCRRGEGGFTLIEVMAAVLVLAVGLLAIAAMQDMALSRNVDANELSLITNLTSDMVERIRFNAVNVTAYNGIDTTSAGTQPPAAQPMARGDYTQWKNRLESAGLQNVRGWVSVKATGPAALSQNEVIVGVAWTGRGNLGTGVGGQGTTGGKLFRARTINIRTVIAPDK